MRDAYEAAVMFVMWAWETVTDPLPHHWRWLKAFARNVVHV